MRSVTQLVFCMLCILLLDGCAQIAKESLPVRFGGTGAFTLYVNDAPSDICPLGSKIEFRRYPTGLGTVAGESFEIVVINKIMRSYVADIRLVGTHKETGMTLHNQIADEITLLSEDAILLTGEKNGPLLGLALIHNPFGRSYKYQFIRQSVKPPTADWRNYRWSIETSNCHPIADEDIKVVSSFIQQQLQKMQDKQN